MTRDEEERGASARSPLEPPARTTIATRPNVEVTAELDPPGETRRQTLVFVTWFACLLMAVIGGSLVGAHVPAEREGSAFAEEELSASRLRKAKIAVSVGLFLPACLTWLVGRRFRRGGGHARGIVVDIVDGELRIWGRGYGARVRLEGADVSERLVDVYAGRLGAWRQRRIRVRAASGARAGFSGEIEIATAAVRSDEDSLRAEGGEGDCVELGRDEFEKVRAEILGGVGRA